MTKKALDEHAAAVEISAAAAEQYHPGRTAPWRTIFAAYEAERAARIDLERQYLCAECQHNEARVRELEAERAGLVTAEAYGQATAALAETRAQLARLRDAAAAAVPQLTGAERAALYAELSTPGPTLAEIRRAAQVEVLREMAASFNARCEATRHPSLLGTVVTEAGAAWGDAERLLRKRADDIEAGRG